MVLRLPPQLADQVRKMLRTKQLTEEIEFEFDEGVHKDQHDVLNIMHTLILIILHNSHHITCLHVTQAPTILIPRPLAYMLIIFTDQRNAKFRVGRKKYDAYVVDLPCTVESHKTLDKTTYYKSADIGQVFNTYIYT